MKKGIIFVIFAYIFWGIHPLYWNLFGNTSSFEIVMNRIIWSLVFFSMILFFRKGWKGFSRKIKNAENKFIIFIPALLIGANWMIYIWAVSSGYVIETSFGYFICPLLSVLLGVVFLKERLKRLQWAAVGIAGLGVLIMTIIYGQFPWISLILASTWSVYGLLRKKSPLSPVEGLTLETIILSLGALVYFMVTLSSKSSSYITNPMVIPLFIGSGVISGLPLIIFIKGSKLIPLSLSGILQYIYPTLIFIVGYFIYHEDLADEKLVGFIFIWTAIIIYSLGNIQKKSKRAL